MRIMVSHQTGKNFDPLADRYVAYGLIGHLYSPGGWRTPQWRYPYALDNGAFGSWLHGKPFDDDRFLRFCEKAAAQKQPPMWLVVPDVVADRDATLRSWDLWAPILRRDFGWPLAFALQDGMTDADVPGDHSLLFLGGTMPWKLATLRHWCQTWGRVHVARVNRVSLLYRCHELGAESVDGTGWWHTKSGQYRGLCTWLAQSAGETPKERREQGLLFGVQDEWYPADADGHAAEARREVPE